MERIDKLIASQGSMSRAEVAKMIKDGLVTLDGKVVTGPGVKADAHSEILVRGFPLDYKQYIYLMLDKPPGVVSASRDPKRKTVVDLVPGELFRRGLFPAGRLDADTTGFVLLTDDGDFAHKILSPKNHVEKKYIALLEHPINAGDAEKFIRGIALNDGTLCLPAKVRQLEGALTEIIICEGKYHQIKRMFAAVGNGVVTLRRTSIGGVELDASLGPGGCRELNADELQIIRGGC